MSRRPAPAAAREPPVAAWVPALRCAAAGMTYVGVVARTNPHTSVIAEWPRNPHTPVIPNGGAAPHHRHPGMAAQPTYPGPRRPPLGCRRPAPAATRESPVASWVPALRCATAGMTYVGVVARTNPHTSVIAEWPRNPHTTVIPEWRRSRHIRDPGGRRSDVAAPPPRRPENRPWPPGSRLSAALRPG